jgi:hypothetical protein
VPARCSQPPQPPTSEAAPYSVKSWIDPTAVELSSSSQTAHKRIYVDAMSPDYTVVGKSEWNGVSVSTSQFADGPPGLYVYGGEALAAELTVSPVDSDIVVPDKCHWLDV